MANFTITADSKPVYDKWGFWEGSYWGCEEWRLWYFALKKKYGKDEARIIWVQAWEAQEPLSSPIDCRTYNTIFKEFIKAEGLADAVYSGLSGLVFKGINVGVEATGDIIEGAGAVVEGVGTTSKALKYLIPVAFVVVLIGVGAYSYNAFVKGK